MRLFRRHTEFRGLALFALALQLVLSFGHSHADGAGSPARFASTSVALACRTITRPAPEQNCPERNPVDAACAVCWTIAHAGSVVLAEPPAVPAPAPAAAGPIIDRTTAAVDEIATASFEARGPPSLRA